MTLGSLEFFSFFTATGTRAPHSTVSTPFLTTPKFPLPISWSSSSSWSIPWTYFGSKLSKHTWVEDSDEATSVKNSFTSGKILQMLWKVTASVNIRLYKIRGFIALVLYCREPEYLELLQFSVKLEQWSSLLLFLYSPEPFLGEGGGGATWGK